MAVSFEYTDFGKKLVEELNKLKGTELNIGIKSSATYPDGLSVAEVAAKNEFGDSKTPSRPFMRQAISKISKIEDSIASVLDGSNSAESIKKMLGDKGVELVQEEIIEGNFVPNAPYTVEKKGTDMPLIDTGLMFDSITWWEGDADA